MLLERKIIGRLDGEQALQFASHLGYNDLKDTVKLFGADHNFTRLRPDLSGGIDPDDAFSRVPYEKGAHFLYYLQVCVDAALVAGLAVASLAAIIKSNRMRRFNCDHALTLLD